MSIFDPAAPPWPGRMLSVLRIIISVLFISFGTMKLFGYPPPPGPMPAIPFMSQLGLAGMLEMIGGFAMLLGFFTRPAAFVLCGEMAVAYFKGHFPTAFFPTTNNGVPAVLYCFLFLYFVFAGAGDWSIDAMIARSKRQVTGAI